MPRAARAASVCGRTPASANDCNVFLLILSRVVLARRSGHRPNDGREDPSERAGKAGRGLSVYVIGVSAISFHVFVPEFTPTLYTYRFKQLLQKGSPGFFALYVFGDGLVEVALGGVGTELDKKGTGFTLRPEIRGGDHSISGADGACEI